MSENQAPLKRNETPAATLLRYLAERPGTVSDLLERTHKDTSLPDVGEPGWRIFTTHTVADFFAAIDALGDLVGHKFLRYDEKSRVITLTLPVAARDEAAELREENKRLRALVDELLLAPNPLDDENMRLRAAITEWAEATQALNDVDSAWDNAIYAGEDTGGYMAAWPSALARAKDAEDNLRRLAEGEKP